MLFGASGASCCIRNVATWLGRAPCWRWKAEGNRFLSRYGATHPPYHDEGLGSLSRWPKVLGRLLAWQSGEVWARPRIPGARFGEGTSSLVASISLAHGLPRSPTLPGLGKAVEAAASTPYTGSKLAVCSQLHARAAYWRFRDTCFSSALGRESLRIHPHPSPKSREH